MSQGFVVSDKVRSAVFVAVANGEADLEVVVKRHRLIARAAERAARELKEEGLLAEAGGRLSLTGKGEEVARDLKRKDASFFSA